MEKHAQTPTAGLKQSNMAIFGVDTFQLALGALTVLFSYWLWTKSRRSYSKYNIPPFPVKPWPFVGHFFMVFGIIREKLKEWRRTGGDIYSLDTAGQLNILVNDFKDIKEIWVKHADSIVNFQHSFGDEIMNEYNTGILAARDDNWKEQRGTTLAILRRFGVGTNVMAENIQTEVQAVIEKLAALKGQPKDVKILINTATANIISSVAVGKRFDYDDPYLIQLIEPLNIAMKYLGIMVMQTPFKQVSYLPGDMFQSKKWTNAVKYINEVYSKPFVHKFKESFNEDEEPQNYITAYLKEMKRAKDKGAETHLDEANLVTLVRTLLAAGTDNTSTAIMWCLLYMLHYPQVQEKVYQEIDEVVGTERTPNMSDKPKLVYLNAVIMETQRWCSVVPIGFRREVSETFEYGGFTFPKGSVVWPILHSVHYDKKIWGDPENFRPERFIDQNGALINREELIPFGVGRRICMGEALVKMELYLFLSAIFQRFKLEPVDRSNLPTLKEVFLHLVAPHDFKLRFIDRKA